MGPDRPAFRQWWAEIQGRYSVRANIGISGREYAKYGTSFDNRLLVIDKCGPTQTPPLTGVVESVADLPILLEPIRHARPGLQDIEQPRTQPTGRADSRGQRDSLEPPVGVGESRADSASPGGRGHRGADDRGALAAVGEAGGAPRGGDAPDDANRSRARPSRSSWTTTRRRRRRSSWRRSWRLCGPSHRRRSCNH